MPISIGIIGVPGKMAARLAALLPRDGLTLGAALARPGSAAIGASLGAVVVRAFAENVFADADVWIEFAHAGVTAASVAAALAAKKPLVVCTTGHDEPTEEAIARAATHIPILIAPNTSLGVAVLNATLKLAVKALGPTYAAEIVEMHHARKKDAPSGTALHLLKTIEEAREASTRTTGRSGLVGARRAEEIGVFAVRGGNVTGEHTVYLIGPHDRIELSHRAQSRELFADGALHAARWLAGQPAGAYTMEDCLDLQGGNR